MQPIPIQPDTKYFGFACADCTAMVAIMEFEKDKAVLAGLGNLRPLTLKCPTCGHVATYPVEQLVEFTTAP